MLDELRIHRAFRDEQRPSSSGNDNDFDKVLFKNLVEMVPLVESLMVMTNIFLAMLFIF